MPFSRSSALAGLILVALAAGAVDPARAEVRLSREADGDYRVAVMSWWEIPFRSVVRQQHDFSCGSAAVATLLSFHYRRPTSERAVFAAMWERGDQTAIRRVGFSMFEMKTYLESVGYRVAGFRLTVDQLPRLSRPTIVLIDLNGFRHFVVVKGVRGNRVLLGDSVRGLTQYDVADFARIWNGIALAILDTPGVGAPRYDLAGDWGPWSQAPLERGNEGLRVAIGDLTTSLPPSYQLTPQILLDVRVGTVR
jgi:predicted double-glycine peptidase